MFRRMAAKTECSKRTGNVKYFSVYIDCNPESESTLWSCDAGKLLIFYYYLYIFFL